jgi:hypothetical protein
MALQPYVGPWSLFQFRNTDDRTLWTGDQPVARPLPTRDNTNTGNMQISMPRVGFEPNISTSERAKIFHALDRAATVIGKSLIKLKLNSVVFSPQVNYTERATAACRRS